MVYYDPTVVGYGTLLDAFFGRVDVTTVNGQGNGYSTQYRTGVYTHTAKQAECGSLGRGKNSGGKGGRDGVS